MKKLFFLSAATLLFSSCSHRLGDFTVLANGNMDSKTEYIKLAENVEAKYKTKKDDPLEECVDKAVNSIPGGEFMKNVSIYVSWNGKRVRVVGDVYGIPVANQGQTDTEKKEGGIRRN